MRMCTAHRASVSQERLDRLCSNLACGLGVTKKVLSTSHGWGGASLHVRTCTLSPYLRIRLRPTVLKFDVWLETQWPIVMRYNKSEVG